MDSLFWKIFFSFLGAMALIVVSAIFVSFYVAADRFDNPDESSPATLMISAARVLETQGVDAFAQWLADEDNAPMGMVLLAVDRNGKDLLGRPVPERLVGRQHAHNMSERHGGRPRGPGPRVRAPDGRVFRLALVPVRPGAFGILGERGSRWAILLIALSVSAVVCYFLARYLSAPVRKLQAATRELASGNLSARAGQRMGARRDEFGVLARDFDTMAVHIETLLLSQRELLRNISHELRSPLARLSVALGLARRKAEAAGPELDRIELETQRLDQLIGEVLRLTSLDRGVRTLERQNLALTELVDSVVEDAGFEAGAGDKQVTRTGGDNLRVTADADLLRSALDNIVRNAVRYTQEGTSVTIHIGEKAGMAVVTVRDNGPGVPPAELERLFEPFYRVAEARDRGSGGHGLGLAIANACVRLHNGTLLARNVNGGGLEVELTLPLAASGAGHGIIGPDA